MRKHSRNKCDTKEANLNKKRPQKTGKPEANANGNNEVKKKIQKKGQKEIKWGERRANGGQSYTELTSIYGNEHKRNLLLLFSPRKETSECIFV